MVGGGGVCGGGGGGGYGTLSVAKSKPDRCDTNNSSALCGIAKENSEMDVLAGVEKPVATEAWSSDRT